MDIVGTMFRVAKGMDMQNEGIKLETLKVRAAAPWGEGGDPGPHACAPAQEIGFAQMRVADGVGSLLQLNALLARLCMLASGQMPPRR